MKYVNAYSVDRNYGGPEEGGWWYDSGEPIASIPLTDGCPDALVEEVKSSVRVTLEPLFTNTRGRGSVLGGPDLEIVVEDDFAKPFPLERPHYE